MQPEPGFGRITSGQPGVGRLIWPLVVGLGLLFPATAAQLDSRDQAASARPAGITAAHPQVASRFGDLPLATRLAVSRLLGGQDPSYAASVENGRTTFRRHARDLSATLDRRGVE